ncbi:hypothetical protein [Yersinia enterocolitica]|uniref:Uncharacterized protein n=1 Tax=Yersinia enterocolitica TaxID=630 RepID=A0ABM9RWA7_YEREN|nr:hypothetical protein [Yersinia enterocolitica]CND34038.1 Uncharacterised protein [Yersinia enterocolitica]CQD63581.1 Uncharacterised protein [Yersinia enterocolitica]CRX96755.1 Uncharacterised protein [Yersinia enterocolitica]
MHTSNAISALGLLHALAGNETLSIQLFEAALATNDYSLAINFIFMLRETSNYLAMHEKVFDLADRFGTKELTVVAYSTAFRFGDREKLDYYFDKHIKLLSDEERREDAMKHKNELITELDEALSNSGCTKDQLVLLAKIIWKIVKEYGAHAGFVELNRNNHSAYIVDVKNKDPKTIAKMNYSLAEAICSDEALDGCELVARFSSPRQLHTGVSYSYAANNTSK